MQWSTKAPKEQGLFWFYGLDFGLNMLLNPDREPELILVRVRKIINGYAYVGNGRFISEKIALGFWQKAEIPKIPKDEFDKLIRKEKLKWFDTDYEKELSRFSFSKDFRDEYEKIKEKLEQE